MCHIILFGSPYNYILDEHICCLVACFLVCSCTSSHALTPPTSQVWRKHNQLFPHSQTQQGLLHVACRALACVVQRTNRYGAASHWPVLGGNGQSITTTMDPCLDIAYKTMSHIHAMNHACVDTAYKTIAGAVVFKASIP